MVQEVPDNDWGEVTVQFPKMQAVEAAAAAVVEGAVAAVVDGAAAVPVVGVAVPLAGGAEDGVVVDAGEPLLLEFDEQADSVTTSSAARARRFHPRAPSAERVITSQYPPLPFPLHSLAFRSSAWLGLGPAKVAGAPSVEPSGDAKEEGEDSRVMDAIETDYLVIGAGAAGMSFTDALIDADHDCDVVMVDRRSTPGGHWNDAYPFVRLHQPAACYGVNSRPLGQDRLDVGGLNAGLYQQAEGVEICEYFRRVMDEHHVASGQVRFFPMSNYLGLETSDAAFVASLTGVTTRVNVRRAVVDARYLEPMIPSRHVPSFTVDSDVRCVAVNKLVDVREPSTGYTIIGGGKTGSDACTWLLESGVDPDKIRWIRARDAWMWNRAQVQPLELVTDTVDGISRGVQASGEAEDVDDLFARLEACGQLLRLDPNVIPTMYHAATLTRAELELLRSVENVVRLGHVKTIGAREVVLERGTISTDPGQLYVDCSAGGLGKAPARPIFEIGRITLQCISTAFPTFNAAVIGYLEASRGADGPAKSNLSPTNRYPDEAKDWIPNMRGQLESLRLWNEQPDMAAWLESSRLNIARGMFEKAGEPRMAEAITRLLTHTETAVANLERLYASAA